jgi:hypothetical protein
VRQPVEAASDNTPILPRNPETILNCCIDNKAAVDMLGVSGEQNTKHQTKGIAMVFLTSNVSVLSSLVSRYPEVSFYVESRGIYYMHCDVRNSWTGRVMSRQELAECLVGASHA